MSINYAAHAALDALQDGDFTPDHAEAVRDWLHGLANVTSQPLPDPVRQAEVRISANRFTPEDMDLVRVHISKLEGDLLLQQGARPLLADVG